MRQVILDTETTGLSPEKGHRVIEIGCLEMVNRKLTGKSFHHYLQPDREIDEGAKRVHGITEEFLKDKPRFKDVAIEFFEFIEGAQLIIHNAPFDVGFLNHEISLLDMAWGTVESHCKVIDTLTMARDKHPGQKNSLDALCKRYNIDNSGRTLHGALLDSQILAEVYLAMTGGQEKLSLVEKSVHKTIETNFVLDANRKPLKVLLPTQEEITAHLERLKLVNKEFGKSCLWEEFER